MKKNKKKIFSTYVHIPFCEKKCHYCSFLSFENLNLKSQYLETLLMDIKKNYDKTPQKTLYIGGGTPSVLEISEIEKLINCFNFKKNPEITIEVNPKSANKNYLKELKKIGINRLSIGVQSFNDDILNSIGRLHNSACAIKTIENAKSAGFENISIDLMYGLPNQTLKIWEETLDIANSLDIQHISLYGLKIEHGSKFYKKTPKNLPDDDLQEIMFKTAIKKLKKFKRYEISNFAISKKFQGVHNLNYWHLGLYNAFGLGASGYNECGRYKKEEKLEKYIKEPKIKKEKRTKIDELNEEIIIAFRLTEGINTNYINKKFDINFEEKYSDILNKYITSKHIKKTKNGFCLTTKGLLVSNYILSDFLIY